jgi:predicted Zn-dependent protease
VKAWLAVAVAACGGQAQYLGAPLPDSCGTTNTEACAGWMAEQDLRAGGLDFYPDAALHAYVQQIADRLAQGTRLARTPRIVISDHDGTYAAFGNRIVIGRIAIEKLGSEAELAAIVAHELVHVEGRHATVSLYGPDTDDAWLLERRDAEGVADERAVALLEHAGYAPVAMTRALEAELPEDEAGSDDDGASSDDEHPPRAERLAHVAELAGNRDDGFDGRVELLEHVDHMVIGRDTRLGVRVDNAWVIAVLGVAIELRHGDIIHIDGDTLVLRHGASALTAYPIGSPWARELAATLEERASTESALGPITVGIAPAHSASDAPLARLEQSVRDLLPQPTPGTRVVVLDRPRGGLVIELGQQSDPDIRKRWLEGLRAASDIELQAAEPRHIAILKAPRSGTVAELAAECPNPGLARALDRGDRVLAAGDPIKCTNR